MFNKVKYKLSFMFGRQEHFYARLLFFLLVITFGLLYIGKYTWAYWLSLMNIAVWILYYVNHRAEKFFHPKQGNVRI